MIGGRVPIHDWPRVLSWAFEWHRPEKDLILTRGEPWFCARFEIEDPSRKISLVEAEMTPELAQYLKGMDTVTQYVSRTFSLFPTARSRRPADSAELRSRSGRDPGTADTSWFPGRRNASFAPAPLSCARTTSSPWALTTATACTPSPAQDQASPAPSDTSALMRPLAVSRASGRPRALYVNAGSHVFRLGGRANVDPPTQTLDVPERPILNPFRIEFRKC